MSKYLTMNNFYFKEWFTDATHTTLSDVEIANLYFHHTNVKISEIANRCGKSVGEVYRILHQYGRPNRQITNHETVISFAQAGFPINKISEFTGYTPRNVRYILKRNQ